MDNLYQWFELKPDANLNVMKSNQSPSHVIANILAGIETLVAGSDLVIVQGDTATAFAGAMGAFLQQIPVAHLEAGLRTNNRYNPFPEEMFRRQITQLTNVHLAPTDSAADNLKAEGIIEQVHVVGNTVIDALKATINRLNALENKKVELAHFVKLPFKARIEGKKFLLVTMHRRENHGKDHEQVASALKQIISEFPDCEVVFPVHPNPAVHQAIFPALGKLERVHLLEPVDYVTFCWLLQKAYILVTDSGGLQEEGASLGKPTLVLRETTERPEAVEAGVAKLVGTNYNDVLESLRFLLSSESNYKKMAVPSSAFGEGNSSEIIVKKLLEFLG